MHAARETIRDTISLIDANPTQKRRMAMATIFGPLDGIVHDTADALISNNIPTKIADTINGTVTAWFKLTVDILGAVSDITKPAPPAPPPGP